MLPRFLPSFPSFEVEDEVDGDAVKAGNWVGRRGGRYMPVPGGWHRGIGAEVVAHFARRPPRASERVGCVPNGTFCQVVKSCHIYM